MTKGHKVKNQADDNDERQEYACHQERGVIAGTIRARSILTLWRSGVRVRSDSVSVVVLHRRGRSRDRTRCNGRMTGRGRTMGAHGDADDREYHDQQHVAEALKHLSYLQEVSSHTSGIRCTVFAENGAHDRCTADRVAERQAMTA